MFSHEMSGALISAGISTVCASGTQKLLSAWYLLETTLNPIGGLI